MRKTGKKSDKTADTVKTLSAGDVINEIGNLQVSVQQTLAGISAAITGKLEQLNSADTAISEAESRLRELYEVEKEYIDLTEVRKEREAEDEEYNKMIAARNKQWMEQEATRSKKWQREDEEHNYEFNLKKKKFLDDFNAEVESHKRQERIRMEELTKSWSAREADLKSREKELVDLRKQVSDFDSIIKSEVALAQQNVSDELTGRYEHKIQLLMKDMESERNMNSEKITSLNATIGNLQALVADLNKQLAVARQDAKEVTAQALQSASGRQVADALYRVVDSTKEPTKK